MNDIMSYRVFKDKRVEKYLDNHSDNTELIERIEKRILDLSKDPYFYADSFKSKKCPNCKKTRVGNYRIIYYISKRAKLVELIDIGPRKKVYKKWD